MNQTKPVDVADKLGCNRYHTDETHAHIDADKTLGETEQTARLTRACPAALYKFGPDGKLCFDYLGCLECGTCRLLALGGAVKSWAYPRGTLGIEYRES